MADLPPPPPELLDGAALFLDFDGTLVDLAETPDSIHVPPELGATLARLKARLDGRIAIVSGRAIEDLETHLPRPAIAFSGSHGLEIRLADGDALPLSLPVGLDPRIAEEVAAFADGRSGLLVEAKPLGVALHYRLAPEQADSVAAFMETLARRHDLWVQRGNMVVELRPEGATKGDAVRAFMSEPIFAHARPVFVGDDLTDEHGFEAAAGLGGAGVLVGPARPTAAAYRLGSVAAVARWLSQ